MNNPRINPKERGLLKGAIRRVFSRSDLRRMALARNSVDHYDENRSRVKKWSFCECCGEVVPTYTLEVDHINPIIPVDTTMEDMSWDEVVDRVFCALDNLQTLCDNCHKAKTKKEREARKHERSKRAAKTTA